MRSGTCYSPDMTNPRTIAIIGAGPAGLMAAEQAAHLGAQVDIYDRMPSVARKFLMAGRGGLNLTHSEPIERFMGRYGEAESFLQTFIAAFPPQALRDWSEGLGQATFIGSSGRVFPERFKASPLLRAWLRRLTDLGVRFHLRHRFVGYRDQDLMFEAPTGEVRVRADATILALGGASWPRLGSDGAWVEPLRQIGANVTPLRPANAGIEIRWSDMLRDKFAGTPVKPLAISFGDKKLRGEAVVTGHGLEGNAIYALFASIRDELAKGGPAEIRLDLRPDTTAAELEQRLSQRGKQSVTTWLRKAANLSPIAAALVREPGPLPQDPAELAARIKDVPLVVSGTRPLDRAISTAGGLALTDLDEHLMLKQRPGTFVAGEMLDWEAPTGGYLLQACLATGFVAGKSAAIYNPT